MTEAEKGIFRATLSVAPQRPFPVKLTGPLDLQQALAALRRGGMMTRAPGDLYWNPTMREH